jgi:hypothetical protein
VSIVLLTYISIWYQFAPRVSLVVEEPLNPTEPFSAPFVLTNDSALSIYDVGIACQINWLAWDTVRGRIEQKQGLLVKSDNVAKTIAAADKKTVKCDVPPPVMDGLKTILGLPPDSKMTLIEGDISIAVSFSPKFYLWKRLDDFHFVADKGADGKTRWQRQPVETK